MEIKTGGRENGQKIHNAIKLLAYINNLPENKMYGIQVISKNITILTKEECIPIKKAKEGIEKIEDYFYRLNGPDEDIEYIRKIKKELLGDDS